MTPDTAPLDLDALMDELREFERKYGRPSAEMHKAFRFHDRETEDERAWAFLYTTLEAFGRPTGTGEPSDSA